MFLYLYPFYMLILCVYVCMYWCVCFAAVMANKDIYYVSITITGSRVEEKS